MRTPEQQVADWSRYGVQFGKHGDEARQIAIETLERIAGGLPQTQPIKRGVKARDLSRDALARIRRLP